MDIANTQSLPKSRKYNFRWLRLGLFILVCIIAPFSLFYMHYYDSNIEQQELRFFRSLNELGQALEKKIGNLPDIHKKGLLPNLSKLEDEINQIEKDIQPRRELIEEEKAKRNVLIEASNKKQSSELSKLYKNSDEVAEQIFVSTTLIKNIQSDLAEQYHINQQRVTKKLQSVNTNLQDISRCSEQLSSLFGRLIHPTTTQYEEGVSNNQKVFKEFSRQLDSPECQLMSNNHKNNINNAILSINRTITFLQKKQKNLPASNSSEDPFKSGKSSGDRKGISNISTLFNDFLNQKKLFTPCTFQEINLAYLDNPNAFITLFKSFENSSGLEKLKSENIATEKETYIKTLQLNRNTLKKFQLECNIFNTSVSMGIEKAIISVTSFIEFLNTIENKLTDLQERISYANESNKKNNKIKDRILSIKASSMGPELKYQLTVIDQYIRQLRDEIKPLNTQLHTLLNKKEEIINKDIEFRQDLKSINQIPGFENLNLFPEKTHPEISCISKSSDEIITIITPLETGYEMGLMTAPNPTIAHETVSKLKDSKEQHFHIQVPLGDVINAQAKVLPSRFDQVLLADAKGNIYYQSSPRSNGTTKQLGRFKYEPFAYDFMGYENVNSILTSSTDSKIDFQSTGNNNDPVNELIASIQQPSINALSRVRSFNIGDLRFRAFIQPINLPAEYCSIEEEENVQQWYLIGVINEKRFQKSALAAPPVVVGSAILLIIIILLILPFLKVLLADQHTLINKRLRGLVIWSLSLCYVFMVLLCCLLFNHYYQHEINESVVKSLNQKLKNTFQTELDAKLNSFELQKQLFADKETIDKSLKQCLDDIVKGLDI